MPVIRLSTHAGRLERWAGGPERLEVISRAMREWPSAAPPIHILDMPGAVKVYGGGDFRGPFERGVFASAMDSLYDIVKRAAKVPQGTFYAGFPGGISEALARASAGFKINPAGGNINQVGPTGVVGVTTSLHKVGPHPVAGTAAPAAPGGRSLVDSDTGGMLFANPASGTMHLTGANFSSSVIGNTLLLYDRFFDVAKTMASTATEAVTGVPSRYQSTVATDPDYIGGNFLFVEVGLTALAGTAHNWTVCLVRNQANTQTTLPSLTGSSASAIVHRLDHPAGQFFAPYASGDVGIKEIDQMQCSASVATGLINFVLGHPIGFMYFPVANGFLPFDWLTNVDQTPRIFNDAYLAFLELTKPATTAATYGGRLTVTVAA